MVISSPFEKKVKGYESTGLRKVKTFTEKPDLELAKVFLEQWRFLLECRYIFLVTEKHHGLL